MIKGAMVRRLEALLERVRARAADPRRHPGPAADVPADVPKVVDVLAARASAPQATPPEPTDGGWRNPDVDTAVRGASAAERANAEGATEEGPASETRDSRERLVAAATTTANEQVPQARQSAAPIDAAEIEVDAQDERDAQDEPEAQEERGEAEREEPPASSRRPVALQPEERLAQIAFGTEDPPQPLHTPPPESGKLPSAPEGEFAQDNDFPEVHNATPLLPRRMSNAVAPRGLVPEALRAQLAPSDAVAEVIAEAQRFAPSTFVALLDASLGL